MVFGLFERVIEVAGGQNDRCTKHVSGKPVIMRACFARNPPLVGWLHVLYGAAAELAAFIV